MCPVKCLATLSTYGFRGEALAAMCCVANVNITTKCQQDPVALSYKLDSDGHVVDSKPSHLGQGVEIINFTLIF